MRVRTAAKRSVLSLVVISGACAAVAAETRADNAALETKISACASCHGTDGNSTREGVPSLAGQPEKFLVDQLILIREGVRRSELMRPFVRGFDDATIIAIAKHFSSLPARPAEGPRNPVLAARGRRLAETGHCGGCHLSDFSGRAQIPRLAGQRQDYLAATLRAYRDGKASRPDTTMNNIMYGASDEEIRALAHFLSHAAVTD
ncbi:MAG TPA: c-type cytochrome [Gammaproteobacteria bacterium]|nr:c-type cytochrome [Gammaproteobacteria bacterium]